ncbi:MAG: hypothetical protein LWX56_14835 [Ignavibacteria bacterium]|nr:hypothetical protein [Ignavibacteria bacterium]
MRTLILVIAVIILITSSLKAQSDQNDQIYLRNGKIITGTILERSKDTGVLIQLSDGSTYLIKWPDILDIKHVQTSAIASQGSPKVVSENAYQFQESADSIKYYVSAHFGYGVKSLSSDVSLNTTENTFWKPGYAPPTDSLQGSESQSFGAGPVADICAGLTFSKYFLAEFGTGYLFGNSVKNFKGSAFFIRQSIGARIQLSRANLTPYVKIGFIEAFPNVTATTKYTTKNYGGGMGEATYTFSKNLAMGFVLEFGCELKSKNKLTYTFDLSYLFLRHKPNTAEMTSYKVNGVEQISQETPTQIDYNSGNSYGAYQPTFSFNNLALRVGFIYPVNW